MNRIIQHQNDPVVLERLTAQRYLYKAAKRWRNVRFGFSVVLVVFLAVIRSFYIDNRGMAIAFGCVVFFSLLVGPFFNRQIDLKRTLAARIQQLLETELFDLPWDENHCGKKPTPEEVYDYKSSSIPSSVYNWYDTGIGEVQDINVAILLCQRENMRYDSHIRSSYSSFCTGVCIILCFVLLMAAISIYSEDILSVIMFGLIPMTPIVRWFQSVLNENSRDKGVRDSLESMIDQEIEKALKTKTVRLTVLKQIQNEMFIHRRDGYLVPEFYYLICRKRSEERAAYSVQRFLAQYNGVCNTLR